MNAVPQKVFLGEAMVKSRAVTEAGLKPMQNMLKSLPDRSFIAGCISISDNLKDSAPTGSAVEVDDGPFLFLVRYPDG
jgi:hypothetical protein